MDWKEFLKPTKKKVVYSLIISILISILFFVFKAITRKRITGFMSPEEFHIYYIVPIISFLVVYFILCWLVTSRSSLGLLDMLKIEAHKRKIK